MSVSSGNFEAAVDILADASRLVVTTGAGMSKESGIPTFRDAPSALWANYNPEELATREGFAKDPPLVWRWYVERRRMISAARPHPGHEAVAALEKRYRDFMLLTQNIDNLHREAGSERIVELHGNIFRFKCFDRDHAVPTLPDTDEEPPRCECGSFIRPDIVWFGEILAREHVERAYTALVQCDALLVVGTSGIVYPAAGFPMEAKRHGAKVIEVNPEETPIGEVADVFLAGPAGEVLPALVGALEARRGDAKNT